MWVPHERVGLDWGTAAVTMGFTAVILVLVGYLTIAMPDVDPAAPK